MHYMLDTDICIYIIKRKPAAVFNHLQEITPGDAVISAMTLAELEYGVAGSQARETNHNALKHFQEFVPAVEFDAEAAAEYGRLRWDLEQSGQPIGSFDTLIAAHALALDLILVTNNERHYRRVTGLTIENWTR